jgi:hypothetical protein
MAEEKKPIDSVPPPTDEIDGEWSEEEAPAKAASPAASTRAAAAPSPSEEDDDEEEGDEDEDEGEEEDDEEEDDEDDEEEGEEEDDEEEDDDEEEEEAGATSSERSSSNSPSQDWLPDWAPWATLGGLLLLGLAGGLGLLPFDTKLERVPEPAETAAAAATATATATTTTTASARRPSPAAANNVEQGETISASHILISYQGALRANPKVTRSKEEAKKVAEEVAKKAKSGADFKELVKQYSDEPRAGERGGDLGTFTRNRMVKPFSDAAFALEVNQISGVVETPFGFHVIKRTK